MSCFVAIATTYIFGTLLTANGNLRVLNQIAIGGMLLNLVLNFILIPKYEALGSAYASLITQFLIILFQLFVVRSVFKLNMNVKFLVSLGIYLILLFVSVWAIKEYVPELSIQLITSGIVSFILALILRILDIKKMILLVLKKEGVAFE